MSETQTTLSLSVVRLGDHFATVLVWLTGLLALALPLGILGFLAVRGMHVMSWEFLLTGPSGFPLGTAGGIGPAILGTLYLVGLGLAVALPLGVGGGIYLSEFAPNAFWVRLLEFAAECLAAIPAVIYGLFGYALLVVFLAMNISLLAGGLTLGLMMFPIILIGSRAALAAVPSLERESALALGVSRSWVVRRILLPRAWPGIAASVVLAAGHAAGSAAPVMFTASTVFTVTNPAMTTPVMTLPTHLYNLVSEAVSFDHAYGTALVLVVGILLANALSMLLRRRLPEHS
jgi:phosphate transport system permease protein